MKLNTINLQVVRSLGNYESLRIGAEWTPDSNQTIEDAAREGMAELNAAADAILGKVPAPAPEQKNNPVAQAAAEGNAEKLAKELDNALTQSPNPDEVPDILDQLNADREGESRDVITLDYCNKLNTIIGRLASGVAIEKVFEHYRFDSAALSILRASATGQHVAIAFGDQAIEKFAAAISNKKDITNILCCVDLDENGKKAIDMAYKLNQ